VNKSTVKDAPIEIDADTSRRVTELAKAKMLSTDEVVQRLLRYAVGLSDEALERAIHG